MAAYLVPASYGEAAFTEKRSRFTGRVWPISAEEEALAHIKEMRETYWDATHNVYAYSLKNGGIARFSDDGEPSGTSGMPVLNVFRQAGVEDFCCVVTRYFGGILLGAGGLVRAYSRSASEALTAAGRAEMRRLMTASFAVSYAQYERVKAELGRFGAEVRDTAFSADVTLTVSLTEADLERLRARVTELTAGQTAVLVTGEELRPVPV